MVKAGGITIVQDAVTSAHFDMPADVLDLGRADVMMSLRKMARRRSASDQLFR